MGSVLLKFSGGIRVEMRQCLDEALRVLQGGKNKKLVRRIEEVLAAEKADIAKREADGCTNPECEDGSVYEDYCPKCEQPIGRTCTDCKGTGKKQ